MLATIALTLIAVLFAFAVWAVTRVRVPAIGNDRLKRLADKYPVPQEWYDE